MKFGIVGSGKVGIALGKALLSKGYDVLFNDVQEKVLDDLRFKGNETTSSLSDTATKCDVIFIAVPTDSMSNGNCDISILRKVVEGLNLFNGIIIQVSTAPPGTARLLSKLTIGKYIVHPSFYSMARMEYDALHPVNVLLGSANGEPSELVTSIFSKFDGSMVWGVFEEIEMIKYADNCLSATLITYWNQIFLAAKKMGLDAEKMARIVDRDPQYRSIYRFSGKAYAGVCLPKDTVAFRNFLTSLGVDESLIDAVHNFNIRMKGTYGENDRHLVYRP